MFDRDHGVARFGHAADDAVDAVQIPGMQTDARFVEQKERVRERRAEGLRECDALQFSARERAAQPVEREVAQTRLHQIVEARCDFMKNERFRRVPRLLQGGGNDPVKRRYRHRHHFVKIPPRQLFGMREILHRMRQKALEGRKLHLDPFGEHVAPGEVFVAKARSETDRTGRVGSVKGDRPADVELVLVLFEPREEAVHAAPAAVGLPLAKVFVALKDPALGFFAQFLPGTMRIHAGMRRAAHEKRKEVPVVPRGREDGDRSLSDREPIVRKQALPVVFGRAPVAVAVGAGADGRIEAEVRRTRLFIVTVAVAAVKVRSVGREADGLFVSRKKPDFTHAPSLVERRRKRLGRAFGLDRRGAEAVGEHDETAGRLFFDHLQNLRVALLREHRLGRFERKRQGYHKGEGDADARVESFGRGLREAQFEVVPNRFRIAAAHRTAAALAKERGVVGKEHLEVVVETRERPDGGAGRAHRVGVLDGDRRKNAGELFHLRRGHAVDELPRVGAEGFDVAALSLGKKRVDDERALSRARGTGDRRELSSNEVEVEVSEIVL